MILRITCPSCARKFAIEPTAAMREIDRLKREVSDLKAKVAAMEMMKRTASNPLSGLFGGLGL